MVEILGLASNRGRNLLHIHELAPGGAELAAVVSNAVEAPILEAARDRDIPAIAVVREPDEGRIAHERRIVEAVSTFDVDLVCLDGYMRVLSGTFLDAMPITLNVHPSLLPSFPGTDAWGDALDAGVSVTGCTVHVVTDAVDDTGDVIESEIDAGPIVTQEPVPVYADDDPETLADRVLYTGEFVAYPRAVEWLATGTARIEDGGVTVAYDQGDRFPARRISTHDRLDELRYGENPHQSAAVYTDRRDLRPSVVGATNHTPEAKALSYNNYNDADAALALVREFDRPAAAVIKHTNPAGCATAGTIESAYEHALATDAKSAFGGVVALNRPCDGATASAIVDSFKEVVIAPGYADDAIDILQDRDSLRVLEVAESNDHGEAPVHEKDLIGGRLVQDADDQRITPADLEVVTDREPDADTIESLCFAWHVCKHVKSNAIVLADGTRTVGIGAGQVSRVDAVELAVRKGTRDADGVDPEGAVLASDAFFPFADGVETAADAGIAAIVQPGGSNRDADVIAAANERDLAMVLTGTRAFRHD